MGSLGNLRTRCCGDTDVGLFEAVFFAPVLLMCRLLTTGGLHLTYMVSQDLMSVVPTVTQEMGSPQLY